MSHRPQNSRHMRNQPNNQQRQRHHHQHHQNHHSMRLLDFLNHRSNYQLNETDKYVCEFSQDRNGSKFIQRKLDDATDNRKNKIFEELHANLHALMMHCFANFVVQKFFTIGNFEQRKKLYDHIKAHFLELSLNKYGCRVVQKAIETATSVQFAYLLDQFTEENIMGLVFDANGNHVVQNIFRTAATAPNRHIQDVLFRCVRERVQGMCYHLYGCRVIQCILQHGSGQHRDYIFSRICSNLKTVILDRYGNYVVQNLASNCSPPQQNRLIQFVLENLIDFSSNKYASNVVETCIRLATPEQQHQAMQMICDIDAMRLHRFCIDASANYVVQRLIETASPEHIDTLLTKIMPYAFVMERYVCGRKIIEKLKTRRNDLLNNNLSMAFDALYF